MLLLRAAQPPKAPSADSTQKMIYGKKTKQPTFLEAHGQNKWIGLIPPLLLVFSLGSTLVLWQSVSQRIQNKSQENFSNRTEEIKAQVIKRLQDHEKLLRGGLGLFNGLGDVSRSQWRQYISALELDQNHPGIQGVGYAQWILPQHKPAFIRKIRAEGFPEYTIKPEAERSIYTSIIYLEPFNWRNQRAFGYDMYSEPLRRQAMDQAMDQGLATISNKITLVQEVEKDKQNGILMYVPVFERGMITDNVSTRRSAIKGFVYSPIRMTDFVTATVGKLASDIAFEIQDETSQLPDKTLYNSLTAEKLPLPPKFKPFFQKSGTIDVFNGRIWAFSFKSLPAFEESVKNGDSAIVLFSGTIISLLLSFIAFSALGVRQKALALASQKSEELIHKEDFLRQILNSAAEAIYGIDMEGRCTFCNQACLDLLGYTAADELIGKNMHGVAHHSLLDGTPAPHETCRIYIAFRQEQQSHCDSEVLWKKDGTSFPAEYWSYPQRQSGKIVGAVVTFLDITARKQAENELYRINSSLERATARANDMAIHADTANAAKSEFLANMSHEIRTPMNGVIGMTQLLLRTSLDSNQQRYAETIRASGKTLLALVSDILDYSKIEANKLDLEIIDFDLSGLLDTFAPAHAIQAHKKNLEFICAAAPEVPTSLQGDPLRLHQILNNLVSNALKFTQVGEIAVRVSVVTDSENDVLLRFSVQDTGIGIPEAQLGRLFEKFSQLNASTTRTYGGTGLGLAICKQLSAMMGGEIGVRSFDGKGSEFWFTARLLKQKFPPARLQIPPQFVGKRVLIVDDNKTSRETLLAQLKAWGLLAEEASDGPMALIKAQRAHDQQEPLDAALLDIEMPGMDGLALARRIKSDDHLKDLPLLLMSSALLQETGTLPDHVSVASTLVKPLNPLNLFEGLARLFGCSLESPPPLSPVGNRSRHPMHFASSRVLLVEDNDTNKEVAQGIFETFGLNTDIARDGLEALEMLATSEYQLVFMDIHMPRMDGYEATREIRSGHSAVKNPHIPIIAMTANALQGDRQKCLDTGMDDYISKPIDVMQVERILNKWLKGTPLIFDPQALLARVQGSHKIAKRVVEIFLKDVPTQFKELQRHLVSGDAKMTEHFAHTLKGSAAAISGEQVRTLAFAMENAAQAGELALITSGMHDLQESIARLTEELEKWMAT